MYTNETSIKLLSKEVQYLRERVESDENGYRERKIEMEDRIQTLERYIAKLESRLTLGRGVFLGLSFTVGSIIFTMWDKLRDNIIRWILAA